MYSIKKLNTIIRCFNEIEEFSLAPPTQKKLVLFLKDKIQERNRLYNEVRKLKDMEKE